jgi:hypothetical protein
MDKECDQSVGAGGLQIGYINDLRQVPGGRPDKSVKIAPLKEAPIYSGGWDWP